MNPSRMNEFELIARLTRSLPTNASTLVGPGHDCAIVDLGLKDRVLLFKTDAVVETIHFTRETPPEKVGHKALARCLSDIAAMGARPRAALLSLALPPTLEVTVVDGLLDGLLALANTHQVAVVGGNVTRSPGPLMVDLTVTGSVHRRRVLTRTGARAGDDVYVTGLVGDAAVGLRSLQARHGIGPATAPLDSLAGAELRYLRPEPRLRAGLMLGQHKAATACIDLSDGIAHSAHSTMVLADSRMRRT